MVNGAIFQVALSDVRNVPSVSTKIFPIIHCFLEELVVVFLGWQGEEGFCKVVAADLTVS
jgi:hypothetical protein